MAEKENFYDELDKKSKRSFCTCQTLAIGFIILAFVVVFTVVFLVKKITTAVLPERTVEVTTDDRVKLQEKVDELSKTVGASTSLTVTERELSSLLIDAISKDPNIPIRAVQATINPREIVLTGTATQYLNTTLAISLLPEVIDGRIKLELVKIQAGNLRLPDKLTELLSNKLEGIVDTQLSQLKNISIKSIQLNNGTMVISGTLTSSGS